MESDLDLFELADPVKLKQFIAAGMFEIRYQPTVSCRDGSVVGGEALARINDPAESCIDIGRLVNVLEWSGNIEILDFYIFTSVCEYLKNREDSNQPVFKVSVNFSQHTIAALDFVPKFLSIWRRFNLPLDTLVVEVTETAEGVDQQRLFKGIQMLKDQGIHFALDDFGVRGAPIAMLTSNLFDILKIDKQMTDCILENPTMYALMGAISKLCKEIGVYTIVEGVDIKEKYDLICTMGFDALQGYYISKAITAEAYVEFCEAVRPGK